MYNELVVSLNNSYRKFRERERDPAFFLHFLALLALKYVYDARDRMPSFRLDATLTALLQGLFDGKPDQAKLALPDQAVEQLIKKYPATIGGAFENISFQELTIHKPAAVRTRLLALMVELSELTLVSAAPQAGQETGAAAEYLVEKFAEENFHKQGFLYTPRSISTIMAELAGLDESVRVYDPAVGLGTVLIGCAHVGQLPDVKLYGQENHPVYWQLCKFNLLFNGLMKAEVELGDSLRQSRFVSGRQAMQFDRVITHPPFDTNELLPESAGQLFRQELHGQPSFLTLEEPAPDYRRSKVSPSVARDENKTSFLGHVLASLTDKGKAVLVVPHGVLFKVGTAYNVRKQLITQNLVEAVVGLPPNIFYSSKINVALLVLNKAKTTSDLLFIDASQYYQPDRRRNKLRTEHRARIIDTFKAFHSVKDYAHRATIAEVADNSFNLTVKRYVKQVALPSHEELQTSLHRIRLLTRQLQQLQRQVEEEMQYFEKA